MSSPDSQYQAILFDFDGVLVDSEPVHFDCWSEILRPFGITLEWEYYAANCIGVNGSLLVARGFPATVSLLGGLGHDVTQLEMSEYRKMDGGLSCLSVRW